MIVLVPRPTQSRTNRTLARSQRKAIVVLVDFLLQPPLESVITCTAFIESAVVSAAKVVAVAVTAAVIHVHAFLGVVLRGPIVQGLA
jgi:hypothetical protein